MKYRLFWVLALFFPVTLYSQNITSRITVQNGNYIEFFFNHLDDYSNGLSLENYTKLMIYYNDTTDTGIPNTSSPGWRLSVKATEPQINSQYSSSFLPLNYVEVRVDGTSYILSNAYQIIDSGPEYDGFNKTIEVSYDIGKTNQITEVSNESYVVELKFLLETNN